MTVLSVEGIVKSFDGLMVLNGIDLEVNKGDVIAVLGPSGSGKTTLLRCINFLERADEGFITFDGIRHDLKTIGKREIAKIRANTGFVFQSYNLFRNLNVLKNVTLGLTAARGMGRSAAEKKAYETLERVGMKEKAMNYPSQLSGGQQQRVAIARALAADPEIIYFDEPTSALDPELIGEVLGTMKSLADDGMTMIVVTHEMGFARNVSNRVVFLEHGTIIEQAPSEVFFTAPAEERTREFLRFENDRNMAN